MSITIKKRRERTVYLNRALDRGFIRRLNTTSEIGSYWPAIVTIRSTSRKWWFAVPTNSSCNNKESADRKHRRNVTRHLIIKYRKKLTKNTDEEVFKGKANEKNLGNLVLSCEELSNLKVWWERFFLIFLFFYSYILRLLHVFTNTKYLFWSFHSTNLVFILFYWKEVNLEKFGLTLVITFINILRINILRIFTSSLCCSTNLIYLFFFHTPLALTQKFFYI